MPHTCENIPYPFFFQMHTAAHNIFGISKLNTEQENYVKKITNSIQFPTTFYSLINPDEIFLHTLKEEKQAKTLYIPYLFNKLSNFNKFTNILNQTLQKGDLLAINIKSSTQTKRDFYKKCPRIFAGISYFIDRSFHTILYRLFASNTRKIHKRGTRYKYISYVETLGRFAACGFELVKEKDNQDSFLFIFRKEKDIAHEEKQYRWIIKLNRIGKNTKEITVYKFRTMFPYSEYLQEYIYKKNNIDKSGKFKNDFRITKFGKIMRRFWIDEIPMLYNIIKGDIKLVGVRPLSKHYMNLYSKELIKKRSKTKPGLLPPYYADLPSNMEEIQASELNYLEAYFKKPFATNTKYFFKIIYNIIFRRARSK